MDRALRIASVALITAGIVVLLDVAATLLWKEPLSSVYGTVRQGEAEDSLASLEQEFPSAGDLDEIAGLRAEARRAAELAGLFAGEVAPGDGIGRIRIPAIGLDTVFVEGTDESSLEQGPGHYTETPFPGEGGTVGIAGHRTTYLAPFRKLDELEPGDPVELKMPYGTFTYTVGRAEVVDPSDVEIFDDPGFERLALTACHPLYSAAHRLVAFARLSSIELP